MDVSVSSGENKLRHTRIKVTAKPSALQDDRLSCDVTQSKIQVKTPWSASVDNVSSAESEVNLLVVVVGVSVVTVVVSGSTVHNVMTKYLSKRGMLLYISQAITHTNGSLPFAKCKNARHSGS